MNPRRLARISLIAAMVMTLMTTSTASALDFAGIDVLSDYWATESSKERDRQVVRSAKNRPQDLSETHRSDSEAGSEARIEFHRWQRSQPSQAPVASVVSTPELRTSQNPQSGGKTGSSVGWNTSSYREIASNSANRPVSLSVPSLDIVADVAGVGVDTSGSMEIPDDENTLGWYRFGPSPGESGSAVIAGHLDDIRGRAVFFDLKNVEIGAEIMVTMQNGENRRFIVTTKERYPATDLPSDTMFARDGEPVLTLVTCAGSWDRSAGRYTETAVIVAKPVDS